MYTKFDQDLPMKLKMLRLDAGLSQEDFAAKVGISRSCVANYETGKRRPDIHMIRKIATVYSIATDVLIGHEAQTDMTMCESGRNQSKKIPFHKSHRNSLNISHFPAEKQISMLEFYEYIKAKHGKKENQPSS